MSIGNRGFRVGGSILGNRVLRKEDPKFLTVGGTYVDDMVEPMLAGAVHATYVRSQVAHGIILSIDTSEAAAMPGVIGVYTAADLELGPAPAVFNPMVSRTLLATEKVRYVGECVAVVLSETRAEGEDAVNAVIVDIDPLPVLVDVEASMASGTLIYEGAGSNVVFDTTALGMPENTGDDFFAGCEVTVKGRFLNQRVAPCPMEMRGSAVAWVDGRLHQWISTQHSQGVKDAIVATNELTAPDVRIVAPDVGGGFGAKIGAYPEELLLGRLAKKVGRPVVWRETRSESMVALGHGRAQLQYITIGGTKAGKVTHYQLHAIQDCGGFADMGMILAPFMTRPMSSGVYDIPNIECRTTSVVTNTTPIVAYRGAGRPEATAAIERAMDIFAYELGMDPADVRRVNLIPKFMEPHTTSIGQTYDVGDFEVAMDKALDAAGYKQLRADQAARRANGDSKQIGIGVSVYVEITGGIPPFGDDAKIEILEDGRAIVYAGTSPHGQGHATAFSMITAERTGIDMDKIELVWGDTDLVPTGGGTMGSRSLQHGGAAVNQAAVELVEQATKLAARLLEADEADVVLDKDLGAFHVAGTPAVSKTWADLAIAMKTEGGLVQATTFATTSPTFPFGAHVAVVEVDTETGQVKHLRHVACDDAGRVLNPLLLEGQIHGGVAQGTAQALLEEVRYDDDGNPITSNLADYAMISAAELPSFEVIHMETPTPVNPLGAKGIGESGTIGSTPAVQSAVVDALRHLGVTHVDMPATAEKVWRAIAAAAK
ncbi:MAG: putative oxidoreductase molybdopterin-binding subunit [Acidimicrobiales bacterium]|nr:putative oxidoreductase molybdopterin-binding subunit [Acidimicrobiales bacterium]